MQNMVWYGILYVKKGLMWYGVVWSSKVWYGMIWYDMVWYSMVWYGPVWYGEVLPGRFPVGMGDRRGPPGGPAGQSGYEGSTHLSAFLLFP